MRKVEAVLSPLHLEQIKDRLRMIGVPGLTVENVRGTGEPEHEVMYRGTTRSTNLSDRIRMEIVVTDDMVESVINAITLIVRRAEPTDGQIVIAHVEEAFRIRTGEWGADAL